MPKKFFYSLFIFVYFYYIHFRTLMQNLENIKNSHF